MNKNEPGARRSSFSIKAEPPKSFYIIPHENGYRQAWDVFMGFVLLYVSLSLPFFLAFVPKPTRTIERIDDITDYFFMADIPLNFLTSFETDEGVVVTDFMAIGTNYVKTWFFIDFFSTVPLEWFVGGNMAKLSKITKVLRALKFMKMARISKLGRLIPKIQSKFDIKNATLSIVKFMIIIAITAHWCGCIFFLLASSQNFPDSSWASVYQRDSADGAGPLKDRNVGSQYLSSIYWAITIMSTIGFGDIMPGTDTERMFVALMMFVGSAVFAYGICNMCTLVLNLDVETAMFSALQDSMKSFLEERRITKKLKKRIKKYLLYKYYRSTVEMFDGAESGGDLLRHVSGNLKTNISGEVCETLFWHTTFLQEHGSHFSKLISCHLVGSVYAPLEHILLEGEQQSSIFFIAYGTIEYIFNMSFSENIKGKDTNSPINTDLTNDASTTETKERHRKENNESQLRSIVATMIHLPSGCSFNEVAGLLELPAFASAFSVNFSDIYTVPCETYKSILLALDNIRPVQNLSPQATYWGKLDMELKTRRKTIDNYMRLGKKVEREYAVMDFTPPTTRYRLEKREKEKLHSKSRRKKAEEKDVDPIEFPNPKSDEPNPYELNLTAQIGKGSELIKDPINSKLQHLNRICKAKEKTLKYGVTRKSEKNVQEKEQKMNKEVVLERKEQAYVNDETQVAKSKLEATDREAEKAHEAIKNLQEQILRNNELLKNLVQMLNRTG